VTPSTHESRGRRDKRERVAEPPVIAGRVPPHDLDAEAAVLSACMLDAEALDVALEMLDPKSFYSRANGDIFDACRTLGHEGRPVDNVSVASLLRTRKIIQKVGGTQYLGRIVDATPAVGNVAEHARTVLDKYRLRRAIATCQKYGGEGYGEVEDTDAYLGELEQAVYDLAQTRHQESGFEPVHDALTAAFQRISDAAESGGRITGISSGFIDLDQKTAGLHDGDLMIVAARPGMGKTSFVLNIAANLALSETVQVPDDDQGFPTEETKDGEVVAIYSLEMPKEQVATRLVCSESRVDLGKLRNGYLSQDDWANLTKAAGVIGDAAIWIDDTPALTVLDVRGRLRRLQADIRRKRGPSARIALVIIDYLQLMSGRKGVASREQEISEISRGLKQLAKEMKVPVIALSQLNRGVETRGGKDKRPMLSDLRESGAIEQDADVVVFIYRDEYYNPEETTERGIAELIIAKQRNGPTGTVRVRFISSCTKFENLAPGTYEELGEFG
jgi:replicative DNA helicase